MNLLNIFRDGFVSDEGLSDYTPRRILLCQLRQIGDVLLLTPSIRMLKRRFPEAAIDVFTEAKCAPVLENNPDIDRVFRLDRSMGALESLAYYRKVGRSGHDMLIDFQQLPRCRWVTLFSKARIKFTFSTPWYNRPVYTHWSKVAGPYAAKCKAGILINGLGIPWVDDRPRLYLTQEERDWAEDFLRRLGAGPESPVVSVDATHRRITRQWPPEHYAQLMRTALQKRPDLRFLLLFGPGEREVVEDVRRLAGDSERILLPEDMISLRQMAAVLERCALHLGNCSSPSHFATAVDTPTLIIRGSTSSAWSFPSPEHGHMALDLPCQPCDQNECERDLLCLRDLTPDMVLPEFERRLDAALN